MEVSEYADGLTITNSITKTLPHEYLNRMDNGIKKRTCGVVGDPLWKYVKKYVPIAKKYVDFVSASGGIYNVKRAEEIMKLGADSVQLCSGIEFYGYELIDYIAADIR